MQNIIVGDGVLILDAVEFACQHVQFVLNLDVLLGGRHTFQLVLRNVLVGVVRQLCKQFSFQRNLVFKEY